MAGHGQWVYQPDPCYPNDFGKNKLVYRPSDAEVKQLQEGLEHFLRGIRNVMVMVDDEMIKPFSWWVFSWVDKILE